MDEVHGWPVTVTERWRSHMPFKSKAQMRWMFANHPKMAKRWAEETPNEKALPERKAMAKKGKKGKGSKKGC